MNVSEYLRMLGTDHTVAEAPSEELKQAYLKILELHDGMRYDESKAECNKAFEKIEALLLRTYHGETTYGSDKNLGGT